MGAIGLPPSPRGLADGVRAGWLRGLRGGAVGVRGDRPLRRRQPHCRAGGRTGRSSSSAGRSRRCSPCSLWRPRAWLYWPGSPARCAILGMYVYSRTNGAPIGPHEGVPDRPACLRHGHGRRRARARARARAHARRGGAAVGHAARAAAAGALWVGKATGFLV